MKPLFKKRVTTEAIAALLLKRVSNKHRVVASVRLLNNVSAIGLFNFVKQRGAHS